MSATTPSYRFSQCKSAAVSGQPIRKVSATILMGGNVNSSLVTESPSLITFGIHGRQGGRVPEPETNARIAAGTDTRPTYKCVTGDFAKQTAGRYIMYCYTQYVAGQAYTKLNSPAAGNLGHRSINYKQHYRTLMVTAVGGWNYVSGAFLSTPNMALDNLGADHAGAPTRSVPGEFTYTKFGPATKGALSVPYNADYEAKTD